jgi:hypothetical protein
MSHLPVNHPLRPFYRVLAAAAGLYILVFGAVGVVQTSSSSMFDRSELVALGLRTNLAFSLASVAAGAVILLAVFVGRNVDRIVNLWGGIAFMLVGLAMMALLRTDLNFLNFSMATVIVSFVIGLVLFIGGLYGRTGSETLQAAEELARHGGH